MLWFKKKVDKNKLDKCLSRKYRESLQLEAYRQMESKVWTNLITKMYTNGMQDDFNQLTFACELQLINDHYKD